MFAAQNQAVFELLQERNLVSPEELRLLREEIRPGNLSLATLVLKKQLLTREELLRNTATWLGWEYFNPVPEVLPSMALQSLDGTIARLYGVLPLRREGHTLHLLTVDPFHLPLVEDLSFALGLEIRLVVTDPEPLPDLIRQYYGDEEVSLEEALREAGTGDGASSEEDLSESELTAMAGETPIIRFVNLVLNQAIRDKASDIHFEPFEKECKIRYRIDGALYEMAPPPRSLAPAITSRLKVMSNLNIAERRIPQDGRIKMMIAGRPVDLRVSTLPTQFGESVVLRVLDQTVVHLDLDQLGIPADVRAHLDGVIVRPNGIFIVTGPTGSGKTTTLYSALRQINVVGKKLLTAEDPVEYELEGIMQVSIRPAQGLTFASALRSFLRQDPDIIMVGEIRDLETAQIAIQASLTGHLVLSTLHTNDAPGGITRLIDMGVEPFLIASSLEAILAQRLVRRICPACRTPYLPDAALLTQLGLVHEEIGHQSFHYGPGCEACSQTGYKGRFGLFEMLRMTDSLRDLVSERAPTLILKQKALEQGMRTLRDDGIKAIFNGATTLEEVIKYT